MATVDLARVEACVLPVLDQEAVELVDLRFLPEGNRWILRFYVDKQGGVNLDDCEYLSNRIGAALDASEVVTHSYILEVSSPGLDRVLKRERDFLRFLGHRVKVQLKAPLEGRRKFVGYLKAFDGGEIVLEGGDLTARFPLAQVEEARLHPEIAP